MSLFVILENSLVSDDEDKKYRGTHLKYVEELYKQGKVFAAGRFLDNSGGMIIVNVGSREEAEKITINDPYSINKIRDYTIKRWDSVF
ncbi:MAG: hypothetical protein HYU02_07255 [Thaumarchaeota archaeon]|nr:hypothetical protein [Nitrososphaerota archaeon]